MAVFFWIAKNKEGQKDIFGSWCGWTHVLFLVLRGYGLGACRLQPVPRSHRRDPDVEPTNRSSKILGSEER